MNSRTDQELLRDYTECGSEAAFSEVVRRHIDFVYSVALRLVRDAQLAEDVSQRVFLALARNRGRLAGRGVLAGWLHGTAQNLSANAVRADARRRAREQEAAAMNELLAPEPDANWEAIAPQLDAALSQLSEPDRDALLLRYFQHKSANEMAQALGISGEAAQKRVNRAVERLREMFAKRGIAVGATGLAALISRNAVQAAPAGLTATLSAPLFAEGATHVSTVLSTAQLIANAFLIEPHLTQVRELSQNLVGLAAAYQQSGDQNSRDAALQIAINLGRRSGDPSGGETLLHQMIGISVETAALRRR